MLSEITVLAEDAILMDHASHPLTHDSSTVFRRSLAFSLGSLLAFNSKVQGLSTATMD